MDTVAPLFAAAVQLFIGLVAPLLGACVVGSLVVCFLQFFFQLEERGLAFVARFSAVALALAVMFSTIEANILHFTRSAWSGGAR